MDGKTNVLTADRMTQVDRSKRVLAGLSSRPKHRLLRWVACLSCAVAVACQLMSGLTAPLPVDERVADDGALLPGIPVEPLRASNMDIPRFFDVVRYMPPLGRSLEMPGTEGPADVALARRARGAASRTASLDVAVLSVLVEHIDAERRAHRPPQRGVD